MLQPVAGPAAPAPTVAPASASVPDATDDDDHLDGVGALFLTTAFITRTLAVRAWPGVGTHHLTMAVSAAASTDFDLTGQALWPACSILADFIAGTAAGVGAVRGAGAIVELGAGLGLAGLAAAAAAGAAAGAPPAPPSAAAAAAPFSPPSITLTDGEAAILDVLARNAAATAADRPGAAPPAVVLLPWGDLSAAAALVAATPAASASGGFGLILGADVTYSLAAVPALFATATALASPAAVFYLGYVSRSAALDRAGPAAAADAGWGVGQEVEGTRRTMPCGTMEGWVVEFQRGGGVRVGGREKQGGVWGLGGVVARHACEG